MRCIVVGGRGFIGRAIVCELVSRGDSVVVFDRPSQKSPMPGRDPDGVTHVTGDIADVASLRRAFEGAGEVYHLAGRLGTSELEEDVHGAVGANITGTLNVFEAARTAGVGMVFYPSKPNVWLNTYTITKYAAEQFATLFAKEFGQRICSLRLFNAFGPGQALTAVRKIIPTFAAQALAGRPLSVFGDGSQTVDMIFSEDIARITVDAMRRGCHGAPMDLGRGIEMSVNEVAEAVNAHFGNRAGMRHEPMRRGEPEGTRLVADLRPLRQALGTLTFAEWDESLGRTLDWYAGLDATVRERAAAFA